MSTIDLSSAPKLVHSGNVRSPRLGLAARMMLSVAIAIAYGLFCVSGAPAMSHWFVVLACLPVAVYTPVGIWTAAEPERRTLGHVLIAAGALWSSQWIATWAGGPWMLVASTTSELFFFVLIGGILTTPATMRRTAVERIFIWWLSIYFVVAQAALTVTSKPEWFGANPAAWWPSPLANHRAFASVINIVNVLDPSTAIFFLVAMALRVRRMQSLDKLVMTPLVVSFVAIALVNTLCEGSGVFPAQTLDWRLVVQSLTTLVVPISYLVATLRREFLRTQVNDILGQAFAAEPPTVERVRRALRSALGDPTLDIAYWSVEDQLYSDDYGRTVTAETPQIGGQLTRLVEDIHGLPLALVFFDPALGSHKRALELAFRTSRMAMSVAQLQASLAAQLDEVKQSRLRIVEATLEERRRIECDLHDGIQQRMLAMIARVGVSRAKNTNEVDPTLEWTSLELRATLDDVRSLARGIHPSELRQFGLGPALEVVASGLPIDVELDVPPSRFPDSIEATAYFVSCEALVNAVKHSGAAVASVSIDVHDLHVIVQVVDRGVGMTSSKRGTGLLSLSDRVDALGGRMTITSGPTQGTTIRAQLPLSGQVQP